MQIFPFNCLSLSSAFAVAVVVRYFCLSTCLLLLCVLLLLFALLLLVLVVDRAFVVRSSLRCWLSGWCRWWSAAAAAVFTFFYSCI